MVAELKENARAWCQEEGRSIVWRLPLFAYGVFLLFKVLGNSQIFTPLDFLNLGIHELGHVVCMPFGMWIGVAGGSIAQLIAPIYGIWQFHRQGDYFAAAFGLAWFAESLHNLSIYIGDARAQELPLANLFGGDPIHDWNYLLTSAHVLGSDIRYANMTRAIAGILVMVYLWVAAWMLWQIASSKKSAND